MSARNYDQNYFKMYCPACDKKLVVENSAPGDVFSCPGCEFEIETPVFTVEVVKNKSDVVDPLSLLTAKTSHLQKPVALEKSKKKPSSVSLKKAKNQGKVRTPRKKKSKKRFPLEYIVIPVLIFLFIQAPELLQKLTSQEDVVVSSKLIEEKPVVEERQEKEEVIEVKTALIQEEEQKGLKPLLIAEKEKSAEGATLNNSQVKKLVSHLQNYCYECHGEKRHEEELNFQAMRTSADFFNNYINFKMSLKYLESSEMPPPEDGVIPEEQRLEFIDLVGRLLYTIESKSEGKTGPAKIRRLSAVAYDNTVKTITGLDLTLSKSHQIDNTDDISTVSMEKFLGAAQEIAHYSRFDFKKGFIFVEEMQESRKAQELFFELEAMKRDRLREYYFSDFSYTQAISRSMTAINQFNASKSKSKELLHKLASRHKIHRDFLTKSLKFFNGRNFSLLSREGLKGWQLLKKDNYDHRKARSAIKSFISHYEKVLTEEVKPNSIRQKLIAQFQGKIEGLFKFTHAELQTRVSDIQLKEYLTISAIQDIGKQGEKSRYRSFFAETYTPQVKSLLSSLFRRPATEAEVNQFLLRFIKLIPVHGLDNSVRIMMTNIFSNLKFIFRFEQKRGSSAKVDGFELANRLSYFLWNSPPDKELVELAESGQLFQQDILLAHIQKMLQDERASFFAEDFANSWLGISAIKNLEMEGGLNVDMYEETIRFVDYIIRNEVKVTDLINGNYSFMNARLVKHYGLDKRSIFNFEKLEGLDETRGGLLGQAAVLSMTSVESSTNPVLRGNFVLNTILGTPTPPAPANAGALPEKDEMAGRSLREVLEEHRKNTACKGCHSKIDPLGFPLENYDERGRWRENQDTIGELANGKTIDGPAQLKKYLMKNKDVILKNLSANVFSHALGRGLYYYDYYVVNQCLTNLKANGYRFSAIVATIVLSHQFQHKY